MRVTILGCGGSGGVPMPGGGDGRGDWGACDPAEPRNRRRRCSILVESGATAILVDTSPDLREQLLDAGCATLAAVLYTHVHADHVHGIDDLRAVRRGMDREVPIHAPREILDEIRRRFRYVFEGAGIYGSTAVAHAVDGPFEVDGIAVTPFWQDHGFGERTVGYRIGDMAYSTDAVGLSEDAFAALAGVRLWIVDCLRMEPHPTHAHFDLALEWIERVAPGRAVLTHLNTSMDYGAVAARCPDGVEPAYDGLVIEVE